MRTIPQRELRNDNAEVMRNVEQGESYTITRHGRPVAYLTPHTNHSDLRCIKPATKRILPVNTRPIEVTTSTAMILEELRADR